MRITSRTAKAKSPRAAAAELVACGYAVCRIEPGEKRPTYANWASRSADPDWSWDGYGVGIICGPLSGPAGHALVCVDLDSELAVSLADEFLPPTEMGEGRAGKPRSHRWYSVPLSSVPESHHSHAPKTAPVMRRMFGHPGPKTSQLRGGDDKELIRVIGTGGQAVAPPSRHDSGELREWCGGQRGEPARVKFRTLLRSVERLGRQCGWVPKGETPLACIAATNACSQVASGSRSRPRRVKPDPDKLPASIGGQFGRDDISPHDLPLDIIRRRLAGVSGDVRHFSALCAAHGDRNPSLTVTETGDGTALIYCHAGCGVVEIVSALGLTQKDLFPSPFALAFNSRSVGCNPNFVPASGPVLVTEINYGHFSDIMKKSRRDANTRLPGFAGNGISTRATDLLGFGVRNGLLAMPERDDRGRSVGICYRSPEGRRTFEPGGKRGLTFPDKQPRDRGPLYVAEGGTDTAALLSEGERAVGRPSAKPSTLATHWLAMYLEECSGNIVIVGDNDDPSSGVGVGEVAAQELAVRLGKRLGRRVKWALPWPGYKDVRDQIAAGEWSRGLRVRRAQS